jgi:hypothetical protein
MVGNHMTSGATMRYSNFRKDERSVDCLFYCEAEMITQEELKELLHYDSETGIFSWRNYRSGISKSKVAGTLDHHGYIRIKINYVIYEAHRLAWLYEYGVVPKGEIDHRNHNRSDNRIENIRDVSITINRQNQSIPQKHNKSGFLGVSLFKETGKYRAQITVEGKKKHLGYFDTPEQAHDAYVAAKRQFHEGCTI